MSTKADTVNFQIFTWLVRWRAIKVILQGLFFCCLLACVSHEAQYLVLNCITAYMEHIPRICQGAAATFCRH